MAIAFQKTVKDVHYEVRTAGQSVRLYTNDAFHSQHNPNHLFTGAVWDLLALPSLSTDNGVRKVLVLGVGGGTVIHQLDSLHQLDEVTGVELDPVHLQIAKKYFGLRYRHTKLVVADARTWMQSNKAKFDYIVDDVYLHGEVDPERPFYPDDRWSRLLRRHLEPGGAVVQNHIDAANARTGRHRFEKHFDRVLTYRNAMYGNTVVAGFRSSAGKTELKRRCRQRLNSLPKMVTNRLRHSIV